MNPKEVYNYLDNDKRKHNDKFKDIKLFPTCYGGLISCEYYIKITFEMDSLFSSNEQIKIPIDFYEPFNIIDNKTNLNYNENIKNNNYNNLQKISKISSPVSYNIFEANNKEGFIDNKYEEQDLPTEEEIMSHQKNNINNNNIFQLNGNEDDKDENKFNLLD